MEPKPSMARPLRYIMQEQSRLHANKRVPGAMHGYLVRVAEAGRDFYLFHPPIPEGYLLLQAGDLAHDPVIHPFGDVLPLLAKGKALYPGQPGAVLVGPDHQVVKQFLRQIAVGYHDHHESIPEIRTQLYRTKLYTYGDYSTTMASEGRAIETRLELNPLFFPDLEDRSVYAEPVDDGLSLEVCHPWPHLVRKMVSEATGLPPRLIQVKSAMSYQLKAQRLFQGLIPASLAGLVAKMCNAPVLLHWPAHDNLKYGYNQHKASFRILTKHGSDGGLKCLKAYVAIDAGACPLGTEELMAQCTMAFLSVYRPVPAEIRIEIFASPEAPRNTGSSSGEHMVQIALEHHWSRVAGSFAMSPVNWRIENLRMEQKGINGLIFDDSIPQAQAALSKIISISDFNRRRASYLLQNSYARQEDEKHRRQILDNFSPGIGIALAYQSGNLLTLEAPTDVTVKVELDADGQLTVRAPYEPGNMSLINAWTRILTAELGVSPRDISFFPLDTHNLPDPGPLTGGRQYSIVSPLLGQACREIKAKLKAGADQAAVTITRAQDKIPGWYFNQTGGMPFARRTWGAAVLDLRLMDNSYRVQVRRVWLCVHVGSWLPESRAASILESSVRENLRYCLGNDYQIIDGSTKIQIVLLPTQGVRSDELEVLDSINGVDALPAALIPAAFLNAFRMANGRSVTEFPPGQTAFMEKRG